MNRNQYEWVIELCRRRPLPEISNKMAPAFGLINAGFSRWRRNIYSDYIWRIYKSENCGSQEVRWQSADLLM